MQARQGVRCGNEMSDKRQATLKVKCQIGVTSDMKDVDFCCEIRGLCASYPLMLHLTFGAERLKIGACQIDALFLFLKYYCHLLIKNCCMVCMKYLQSRHGLFVLEIGVGV